MSFPKPKKVNRFRHTPALAAILLMVVLVGAAAVYAILTSITVHNNVTVTPGVGLGLSITATQPATCPVEGDPAYGTVSPYTATVSWNFAQGGSETQWFCIENQGTGNDNTPMISITSIPASFTCSVPPCVTLTTNPSTIPALLAQSVSSPIGVTLSATASTQGTGSVDITVS